MIKSVKIQIDKISDIFDFTKICSQQPFDLDLKTERHIVDAKSQLGIFSLDVTSPTLLVASNYKDEDAVENFFDSISKWVVK